MSPQTTIRILAALLVSVLLVGAGIGIAGFAPGVTSAQLDTDGSSTPRLITVSASGEVDAEPDSAVIRLSVEATANNPETARSLVADDASRMRQALIDYGLSEDQIRTVGFNIYEDRYRSPDSGSPEETMYRARHSYEVELSELDQTGAVIDTAIDNGATSVQNVHFTVSDETQRTLREQALARAMENARSNADVIAQSGGVTITQLYSASTTNIQFPIYRVDAEMVSSGDSAATSLDPGPVTVTASVTAQYQIL